MFSKVWNKIKEIVWNMIGPKTIEQTLKITPLISNPMADAIELWGNMYKGKSPWLHEPTPSDPTLVASLGLPAFIASEKARMATIEMKSHITVPTETITQPNPEYRPPVTDKLGNIQVSGQSQTITVTRQLSAPERAEFLDKAYQRLLSKIRVQLEYGIAKGGLIIKPYISGLTAGEPEIQFDFIQAEGFFPLAFDGSGNVTEAAFIQPKIDKNTIYRRLEWHKYSNHVITIKNKAFKSENYQSNDLFSDTDLGVEIPLTEVPEWADLKPIAQIDNVDRLLFAYFKMPEANTIDTDSPLGVSGFSRATNLIKQADLQYSRILWEFQATEAAIDIDRDALKASTDSTGRSTLNQLQQRLYRLIDLGESNTYNPYLPTIRDASLINGLNNILMRIEDVCALSRGTLSDVAAEARTATELKILKQRSYSANLDIQKALETSLKDVGYIMNVYCELYKLAPAGEYDMSFEWDDSILVDVDTELGKRITLMQNGLASKIETRMWYFGETEQQAREALDKVNGENRQSMENEVMSQFEK